MPQHRIPATTPSFGPSETEAVLEAIQAEIDDASAYNEADDGPDGPEESVIDYIAGLKRARDAIYASWNAGPPSHAIVVDAYEETPTNERYSVIGLYPSHEAAYADLPRVVRNLIEDPIEEAEVEQIADTGDGEVFGFFIWIAPWSSGR